ncbi:MAG: ornithine carbamoyltransferase [Chloroflexi bacterium]|nr:ornithine carbamoyltransferase [Chloroflexota bacterium]
MKGKDFLSVADLEAEEVSAMVQAAQKMKSGDSPRPLEGKVLALLFEKPSLRTRVSFEVGIRQLGGECVYLSKEDIGLGTREPESDIAGVLDRWVDGIVARVFSHRSLQILAERASIPVVNALSDLEHPCQAMGDLLTIHEQKGRLDGIKVAFVGDGNNIAASLGLGCASVGANFTIATPKDYQVRTVAWEEAGKRAARSESRLEWVEDPRDAVRDADVVYTDVWVSMGDESEREERLRAFAGYQVDEELFARAKGDAVFMHDMPAHRGEEVSEGMLEHPRSVVFDQAENRLHAQKAILAALFAE